MNQTLEKPIFEYSRPGRGATAQHPPAPSADAIGRAAGDDEAVANALDRLVMKAVDAHIPPEERSSARTGITHDRVRYAVVRRRCCRR